MDIYILGSGTGLPCPYRASPGVLCRSKGTTVLIDPGPGTIRQLSLTGTPYWNLDLVLISHFHPDHVNDLAALLFALRNPSLPAPPRPIIIGGPVGMAHYYYSLKQLYNRWVEMVHSESRVLELSHGPDSTVTIKDLIISATLSGHTENSLAFRIEGPDRRRLVYSGDCTYNEGLIHIAAKADLLILECSFPDHAKHQGHLTAWEAGLIAQRAGVKRLALTHFYPEVEGFDILGSVRSSFHGELILARDLLKLHL